MSKHILIIVGHPSRERRSFCEALAETYGEAASKAGHQVEYVRIATLAFDPILHEGYEREQTAEQNIAEAREKVLWANHLVFVYPLWQFMPPALLKGFMERTFIEEFAYTRKANNPLRSGLLGGKSARLIQTSGMPALCYRFWFWAHGAKAFRDMLKFCGISPVKLTYLGMIEDVENGGTRRQSYLNEVWKLGQSGS